MYNKLLRTCDEKQLCQYRWTTQQFTGILCSELRMLVKCLYDSTAISKSQNVFVQTAQIIPIYSHPSSSSLLPSSRSPRYVIVFNNSLIAVIKCSTPRVRLPPASPSAPRISSSTRSSPRSPLPGGYKEINNDECELICKTGV
jgi:hypothetical protein